ncbi:MAG: flagellar biosynthetic protein FliO [Syntrophales bacterium]|nr:flagellar biosynthetic protein FliO [Syntrophales bacterium]
MEPSYIFSFLKMIFALALVIGIMLGAVYLLKRLTGQGTGASSSGGYIHILATRYMGPKTSVMILACLGRILVVGVTPGAVNLLAEITDPDLLRKIREGSIRFPAVGSAIPAVPTGMSSLTSFLSTLMKRRGT